MLILSKYVCRLVTAVCKGVVLGLISPPILQFGEWVMDDEIIEESQDLGNAYRELAERKGCLFADAGEWEIEMTFDGVHLSPEGHKVFAQRLKEVLKECE